MRADGADVVLTPSTPIGILRGVERTGWDVDVALTNGQLTSFGEDVAVAEEVLERTIAVSVDSPTAEEARVDEGVQTCVADYDAAFPDAPLELANDDVATNVAMACRTFDLTLQILEAAGPELDVASSSPRARAWAPSTSRLQRARRSAPTSTRRHRRSAGTCTTPASGTGCETATRSPSSPEGGLRRWSGVGQAVEETGQGVPPGLRGFELRIVGGALQEREGRTGDLVRHAL